MPPIGNAVRFVDDQHGNLCGDTRQHLGTEALVCQALGRDQQNVDFPLGQSALDCRPVIHVVGVDRGGANSHSLRRSDLVSHQCKQRRDQQRRPGSGIAQQLGRDEVDKALTPPSLLHDQQAAFAFNDVTNGIFLAITESSVSTPGADPKKFQRAFWIVGHVIALLYSYQASGSPGPTPRS